VIDLCFSLGASEAKKYADFFKAIKAHDYRRAAIELIDSDDYRTGATGNKRRRLDTAIELTSLAEEEIREKNKTPEKRRLHFPPGHATLP